MIFKLDEMETEFYDSNIIGEISYMAEDAIGELETRKFKVFVTPDGGRNFGESKNGQGDWYFKICTNRLSESDPVRVSVVAPRYVFHGAKSHKLTSPERDLLVAFYTDPKEGYNRWKKTIQRINKYIMNTAMKLPENPLPAIPDYNKLDTGK